jgi:glucosamine--fructose-6-phosphate aminotransferase (isomerizing)
MLKEINENAQSLRHTCGAFFKSNLRRLKEQLDGADKIIIVGCGTAYNSGLVAKRWFEGCGCTLVDVEVASEVRYFPPKVTKSTLVLAVSQSGETADTVEAASILRGMGAYVVAITNVDYSAITKIADQVVNVVAGCEICVAATKSYIGQLTSLYMLSQLKKGTADCGFAVLNQIAQSVESVVQNDELIDKISSLCAKSSAVFFLGRGIDYAVAVEGSLKLKEVSYIFSDGYPAGELKHGTLALVDEKTLGIIIITHVQLLEKCQSTVEQIVSRHGRVVVITTLQGVLEKLKGKAECVLTLPEADENLSPFLTATAVQLIAYKTAVKLGRNPDRPRNLAKSVTVE